MNSLCVWCIYLEYIFIVSYGNLLMVVNTWLYTITVQQETGCALSCLFNNVNGRQAMLGTIVRYLLVDLMANRSKLYENREQQY